MGLGIFWIRSKMKLSGSASEVQTGYETLETVPARLRHQSRHHRRSTRKFPEPSSGPDIGQFRTSARPKRMKQKCFDTYASL